MSHRVVAQANLSEVLALKERLGVTLNDVVLAACSGAMRSYLTEHDRQTHPPLVAVVPVSVRAQSEQGTLGNRLSAMFVPLASDRAQPLDRLETVAAACAAAKAQERVVGYGAMAAAVSEAVPPALAGPALRLGAQFGAMRRLRPGNLVISNVPGPNFPSTSPGCGWRRCTRLDRWSMASHSTSPCRAISIRCSWASMPVLLSSLTWTRWPGRWCSNSPA